MSNTASNVTALRLPHIAPLRNVLLMRRMVDHLLARTPNMPGIGVMSGFAGLGKSNACAAAASHYRAIYVELRDHFTRKTLLAAVLHEMGIKAERTTGEMFDQVCDQLEKAGKPLILDMADYLVKRKLLDLVLDLYEGSGAAIVLAGEERFPKKLKRESERLHDRVLEFVLAERCDMEDARKLAAMYSPDVAIKDELLAQILGRSDGVARRVVVNIETVRQAAKKAGKRAIGPDDFDPKGFYTNEAPERRQA